MFGVHINDVYIPEDVVSFIMIQRQQIKIKISYPTFHKLVNILDKKLLYSTNITFLKIDQLKIKGEFAFSKRTTRNSAYHKTKLSTTFTLFRIDSKIRAIQPPALRKKPKKLRYKKRK